MTEGESSNNCRVVAIPCAFVKRKVECAGSAFLRYYNIKCHGEDASFQTSDSKEKAEEVTFDDDVEYLRSLDPKDWKSQDHYAVLGMKNLRYKATDDDIKRAYRQKVLKHHPDKRKAQGEEIRSDDDYFTCITKAYEILGTPVKRRSYDSVDPQVDDNLPSSTEIKKEGFYKAFGKYFEGNSRWSEKRNVPLLGDENSAREQVEKFYAFWYEFESWREFSYLDEEEKERGADREERRWIEKQNKAARAKLKKEEMARIRSLVDLAYSNDPRIQRFKQEDKDKKLAAKRARQDAVQAKKAEEERLIKEALAAKQKAEEAERARIEAARAEREQMKKNLRKEKKALRDLCKSKNYYAEGEDETVSHMAAVEKICEIMKVMEIQDFMKELETKGREAFLNTVRETDEKLEAERKALFETKKAEEQKAKKESASRAPIELKMLLHKIHTLWLLLAFGLLSDGKTTNVARQTSVRVFPEGFLFGASTASYQVEGGWDADGKTESIWDHLTHSNPCATDDCSNGDIANDSYNKYKRDVEMLRELGVDIYRFSVAWTRILPSGFANEINEAGVQYYNNLIDELLKYNIQPMITMFHWDLPQKLQDLGGWANPHIVDWFTDYARVLYEKFGDRVKYWITLNEPLSICHSGYGITNLAPRLNSSGIGEYLCAKYVLLSHANAFEIYDKEFRASQGGLVSLSILTHWYEPETDNDIEAAEIRNQFITGLYAHPIFSETGDWPAIVKEKIAAKSAEQGFPRSRLPDFTPEEVELVRGSADYYALQLYTTYLAYKNETYEGYYDVPSLQDDTGSVYYQPSDWKSSASNWLKDYPLGFYKLFKFIKDNYNNPPVFVTENGFSTRGGLEDDDRIEYNGGYLSALLDAIDEGCNVKAYCHWSLMDNFEWSRGYTERFGLYEVDYSDPERTRTPRKSAFVYKEILRTRALDLEYEPDTTVMTIDEGH